MRLPEDDILYIDSKDLHEKETNALAVHPSKLNHLQKFEKESFHKVIIQNSKVEYFTALSFFQISRILIINIFSSHIRIIRKSFFYWKSFFA